MEFGTSQALKFCGELFHDNHPQQKPELTRFPKCHKSHNHCETTFLLRKLNQKIKLILIIKMRLKSFRIFPWIDV